MDEDVSPNESVKLSSHKQWGKWFTTIVTVQAAFLMVFGSLIVMLPESLAGGPAMVILFSPIMAWSTAQYRAARHLTILCEPERCGR